MRRAGSKNQIVSAIMAELEREPDDRTANPYGLSRLRTGYLEQSSIDGSLTKKSQLWYL